MVFNSIKNTEPFMYNNLSIDEVDSFKYLGMTFNRRANFKHSQRILIQQALKAKATLECHVNKHKYMPVRDIFDLFDTLVTPILIFDSEIWGINISKEVEQFHLTFMKRILEGKSTTNNCLVYSETGRYPLYICIYKRIIKYWLKLTITPEHRYTYIIYNKYNSTSWSLFVRRLLYENRFGCVWETDAVGINHALFIKQFELRLMDTFQQVYRADIANSNRCSLYYRLNREFVMAGYLNKVHIQSHRRAMSKLRLSSHRLMIERGRWLKIIPDNRLCTGTIAATCLTYLNCMDHKNDAWGVDNVSNSHVIEDEFHVICICPRYTDIRNEFIKPYYTTRPSMIKFSQLLNTENVRDEDIRFIYKITACYL